MYVVREKELRSAVSPLEKRRADSAPKAERWSSATPFSFPFVISLRSKLALAVDPSRHISQYAHTTWRIQDGVFSGAPHAITQTTDGYLWIGTEAGLLRFDACDSFRGLLQMERICRPLMSLLFWVRAMGVYGSGWKVV